MRLKKASELKIKFSFSSMKKFFLSFFISCLMPAFVLAQLKGNPENVCRNGYFPRESNEYSIAKIFGEKGEKIYFYKMTETVRMMKTAAINAILFPAMK